MLQFFAYAPGRIGHKLLSILPHTALKYQVLAVTDIFQQKNSATPSRAVALRPCGSSMCSLPHPPHTRLVRDIPAFESRTRAKQFARSRLTKIKRAYHKGILVIILCAG